LIYLYLTIFVAKICQQWFFVASRTVLPLPLIACDTKLYRKEMDIKENTKESEEGSWGSLCIYPLVLFEQIFYQVRPYGTEICHPLCARGLGTL
jgi:hypothetical protein